jgi:predicted Zn-dependent protease
MRIFLTFILFLFLLTIPDLAREVKASPAERPISYVRDDETEKFLKEITKDIFVAAGLDPDSIKIVIVNDPSINAYVAGGQNLFVHTGLIVQSDNAAGLIGVLAHETGHIKGAHIIQKDSNIKDASMGTLAGYALGLGTALAGAPPEAAVAIGSVGQNVAMRNFLSYSRDYENAADTVALNVLKKIGISPEGLIGILRKLLQKQKISGDIYDKYLLTHPVSEERINYIENFIKQNPGVDKPTPADIEERFRMVKAKVMGFLESPERTRLYYQNKTGPDAIYARAVAFHKESKFSESMKLIDELIASKPEDPYFNELKAQFLFESGQIDASIEQYRKSLFLLGNSPLVRLKLSEALLASGSRKNWQESTGQLKAILAQEPKNTAALEKLGFAYGKLGKLGTSYLYLAEGAVISGNIPNAKKYLILAEQSIEKKSQDEDKLEELKKELDRLIDKK